MDILNIKKKDFINWFFFTGADQDQERGIYELGLSVVERLLSGDVKITAEDILNGCETSVIPLRIVKGYESLDGEIGDDFDHGKYEVVLID
jgi:hypothetical protein